MGDQPHEARLRGLVAALVVRKPWLVRVGCGVVSLLKASGPAIASDMVFLLRKL